MSDGYHTATWQPFPSYGFIQIQSFDSSGLPSAWEMNLDEYFIAEDGYTINGYFSAHSAYINGDGSNWIYGSSGWALGNVNSPSDFGTWSLSTSNVPIPAAVWLFGSGLIGLMGI